ncbi:MAG: hypothetical protein P8Y42_13885 [Exilibacterium sp.]
MVAVKGSKQYAVKVVRYHPHVTMLVRGIGVALVVGAVVGSYYMGSFKSKGLQDKAVAERERLRQELIAKKQESETLRQEVANLRLGAEVDHKASEDVRNEVIALKAKIAELEGDISFYRGLMTPTDNKRGLTIGSLNVISTGVPRRYGYKLVVQQLAANHKLLQGSLQFNVVGRQGDVVRSIALKDLSEQVKEEDIKLRFKYFQNVEGELVLPPGFEPERIELLAKSTGRNAATVEKKFGWLVQES